MAAALEKHEPRSNLSKVIRLISILKFDLKGGSLLDKMETFEGLVAEYEHETGKKLGDDLKVVVVIMP